ncbi:ADP-ribosylation factor-binding protein GGA3-like [Cololabis saira]|uniref:ADP-ribosylation factor-binding protein GGA3-like n=1 Tax=Cololabis saira TaxID=129043 RepID=UPI002AD357FB|nr:ADP-ribosylation factor-binding protein GGA3-like [Cololabis saira]
MAADGESLESWLNKATNPCNRQEDWEYIMGFCDQINKELEGPQISVRLLAHKVQSPQEWEAVQALTVLEACMKNCGRRFHNEVGKFKFLNELIKIVSPKYLGDKVSEKVKRKVIEMLFTWTVSLPDEAKICEAYQMLKSQGIVLADPEVSADAALIPPPSPRPDNPVFDDEKKSVKLAELLKSKKPEDLQEANQLIKNMVKENEARAQKAAKQKNSLEAVNSSVKLLNEMLAYFSPEDSTEGDKELIKELYRDCDKHRETVVKLATETEDNDGFLGDILQASDDLSHVIASCKKLVEGLAINGDAEAVQDERAAAKKVTGSTSQSEVLVDLLGLDLHSPPPPEQEPAAASRAFPADLLCGSAPADPRSECVNVPASTPSLLDDELLLLDPCQTGPGNEIIHVQTVQLPCEDSGLLDPGPSSVAAFSAASLLLDSAAAASGGPTRTSPADFPFFPTPLLSSAVAVQRFPGSAPAGVARSALPPQLCSFPGVSRSPSSPLGHGSHDLPMLDLGDIDYPAGPSTSAASLTAAAMRGRPSPPTTTTLADVKPLADALVLPVSPTGAAEGAEASLAAVFVPLEAVKPSQVSPVTVYDRNGVRVLLHFATECPPGRPDVLVMVASVLSAAPHPVRNVLLQAAVPKMMKVKLQPPSGYELAPYNPVHPPAAITQVMLLANPLKENVRMRFKLTFMLGEQPFTEVGEVSGFPPADRWGAL